MVRELEKGAGNLGDAIKQAVVYCRDHDILKEFLADHASEGWNLFRIEYADS